MQDGQISENWKIIADGGNQIYLIQTGSDLSNPLCTGRILDLGHKALRPEFTIHSILARGGWEKYTGSQDVLTEWLKNVTWEDLPAEPLSEGH